MTRRNSWQISRRWGCQGRKGADTHGGAVRASDEAGGIDITGIPPATVKPLKVVPLGPFGNELAPCEACRLAGNIALDL